jgi:hypothetical protein
MLAWDIGRRQTAAMVIDPRKPRNWPDDLRAYLQTHYETFLGWETEETRVTGYEYDRADAGLMAILEKYSLVGWHCTRLTDDEMTHIRHNGMQLPNAEMLHRRLEAVVEKGILKREIADRLRVQHQADDPYRANRIWFCFFRPWRAVGGVEDFFDYWGGEALYNSHDRDPDTAPAIKAIGAPCVIEAVVPIDSLFLKSLLSMKIARRFLIYRGLKTLQPVDHDDATLRPVPRGNIRRIVCHSSRAFEGLTRVAIEASTRSSKLK